MAKLSKEDKLHIFEEWKLILRKQRQTALSQRLRQCVIGMSRTPHVEAVLLMSRVKG